MKKKPVMMMVILALVFGFFFTGCPHEPNEPDKPVKKDTWKRVTSTDEILGIWKGSVAFPTPAQNFDGIMIPASSVGLNVHMTVDTITLHQVITMDMDKLITDIAGPIGKVLIWQMIRDNMESILPEEGIDTELIELTDDYKMVITTDIPAEEVDFSGEYAGYAPYINQDRKKLKMVFPAEILMYTEKDVELILLKQ